MNPGSLAPLLLLAAVPVEPATEPPSGPFGKYSIFLIGVGALILLAVMLRLRSRAGQARARQPRPDPPADAGARDAVERLTVDLEETARSVSALLDTKIRVLDKLIRDADERIARLEKLGGAARPPRTRPLPLRRPAEPPPGSWSTTRGFTVSPTRA